MEFAYVSIQGWIVDPYKQCFLYYSFEVLVFPPHYTKIINIDIMTSGVGMVKHWGRCLLMFFEPLSKHPWGFSNVFLITFHPITFISVDDPTLLHDWIFIFRGHQEVFDGIASFKVDMHSMSAAYFLQALAQSSNKVPPCMVSGCCYFGQFVWYLFSFCWPSLWTWSLHCSEPMQDIYISGVLSEDIILPVVTVEGWNIWFLLFDEVCQTHYYFADTVWWLSHCR